MIFVSIVDDDGSEDNSNERGREIDSHEDDKALSTIKKNRSTRHLTLIWNNIFSLFGATAEKKPSSSFLK